MNSEIVNHMISFIEEREKDVQREKLLSDSQIRTDIVKSILEELEIVVKDEDK